MKNLKKAEEHIGQKENEGISPNILSDKTNDKTKKEIKKLTK